jgi:hypothetical protein
MCGCGWDGQLGLGDHEGRLLPEMVKNFNALHHPLQGGCLGSATQGMYMYVCVCVCVCVCVLCVCMHI